ncbi:hypothetical protein Tco_0907395 [Tanacetum coccineum]|uniref:Uncharacterized protein n=1 Tax=Tanacetum coccineum TaxID=301880 RepID=A0ABQ5CJ88_9ASTR
MPIAKPLGDGSTPRNLMQLYGSSSGLRRVERLKGHGPFLLAKVASIDVLAEAYKKAKEVVDAGGTNTPGNHKLLHSFRGRTLYENPWP